MIEKKGTLVTAMYNEGGLLLTADKRTYDRFNGDVDDGTKMFPLGKYTACAITGVPTFLNERTMEKLFDVSDVLQDQQLLDVDFDDRTLSIAGKKLIDSFFAFLKALPYTLWPETSSDKGLFLVIFYHYKKDSRQFEIAYLEFLYEKRFPVPYAEVKLRHEDSNMLKRSAIIAAGNISVYNQLKTGSDSRFDELRNNSQIRDLLLNPTSTAIISLKEAINIIKYFFWQCFLLTPSIDTTESHIGPTIDMALINHDDGFSWLEQNISSQQNDDPITSDQSVSD